MRLILALVIGFLTPIWGYSQYEQYLQKDEEPTSMRRAGAAFSVLESGTGIGGFYEIPLPHFYHIGLTTTFYFLRDSKQIDYYDTYYGIPISYNKKNNVYLIDLLFSVKKRLFAYEMDDSFQPYLSVSAGPVYGMNYPEEDIIVKKPNEFGWAFAGMGAAGLNAVIDNVYIFGIRLQYRYMKFDKKIGERQDHSTFDLRLELGKQF
ncbi:MAG: hypothetical protein JXR46_04710 [Calditrichaceae bacterium]|nr:hypothetical protein [Calditrichaceae bacterium]MBN2708329.1 hypothetical protein [Calditrichaceae bacterium]RQV95218.1 MAG: hypothetical protein EH224_08040 [Calditrichota bacterium]